MRVVSWNLQGSNDGKLGHLTDYMAKHEVEIACLQEVGALPAGYINNQQLVNGYWLGTGQVKRRGMIYDIVHFDTGPNLAAGNGRCSLAVLCGTAMLGTHVVGLAGAALRPLLGVNVPGHKWFYSIHAPSGRGAQGAAVAAAMLANIPQAQQRWACFGDFNCDPAALNLPVGAAITNSGQATHQGGHEIDFAVSRAIGLDAMNHLPRLASDHYSQVYQVL